MRAADDFEAIRQRMADIAHEETAVWEWACLECGAQSHTQALMRCDPDKCGRIAYEAQRTRQRALGHV
jgi:hypothetical protein